MNDLQEQVSVEDNGRILTGVGVPAESLSAAMDRGTPEPVTPERATPATDPATPDTTTATSADASTVERNDDGTFKKTRGQRRFDALTKEREDAHRAASTVAAENADLRRRLEALERAPNRPSVAAEVEPPIDATPAKPALEQFTSYEDWQEALTDWKVARAEEKLLKEFDARASKRLDDERASRSLAESIESVWAKGREVFPDFEESMRLDTVDLTPVKDLLLHAALRSGRPERVFYAISKDPAFAADVLKARDPLTMGLLIADRVPVASVASPASTRPTVVTKAPPPYQPVGSGSKTTSPPLEDLAAKGDFDAYKARRHSDLKAVAHR